MNEKILVNRLKEYFENEDTTNFSVHDFLYAFGSPLLALAYAKLFWPDFIEFEGMVFLADDFDEEDKCDIREVMARSGTKNLSQVEEAFNLFEVPSFLFARVGDVNDEEADSLAEILVRMWRCKLAADFPDKAFVVKTFSPEESGGETAVCFYQI